MLGGGALALACSAPFYLGPFALYLLAEILAWGLFALAFDLLYGYAGMLSLGQSVFFGVGAYAAALGLLHSGLGGGAALFLALGVTTLLSLGLGTLLVRVRSHGFIVLTLALAVIFYLAALNLRGLTGGDDGLSVSVPLTPRWDYFVNLAAVVIVFGGARWLVRTPLGLALQLVRENPRRAASLGYGVGSLRLLAFTLSGLLSGLAGVLYLYTAQFVSPELLDWPTAANPLIWTLFGGAGTLSGPLLGTGILLLAREWLSSWWSYGYPILVGILIILVVRFAPQGLWGLTKRWRSLR